MDNINHEYDNDDDNDDKPDSSQDYASGSKSCRAKKALCYTFVTKNKFN